MEISLSPGVGPALSDSSKTSTKVAYHIDQLFAAVRLFPVLLPVNSVVRVLQVPVVDQRHHHSQSIQLARAAKRIVTPLPVSYLLFALQVSLQPHIVHGTVGRH